MVRLVEAHVMMCIAGDFNDMWVQQKLEKKRRSGDSDG